MIFCGDTVFPFKKFDEKLLDLDLAFKSKPKILNLESLIVEDRQLRKRTKGIALNSSIDVVNFLKYLNVVAVSLANNHITDFDTSIDDQKRLLKSFGIDSFGAGDNLHSASKLFFYESNKENYVVVSFGWNIIGCESATNNSSGVNPMDVNSIFSQLNSINKKYPNHRIICIFHNNYEFELFPQPADRKLFFDLIDCFNLKAIFCHHPHVVSGCEIYNNIPIFYSLGNFYLPEIYYNGYDLQYPDNARFGLCVELGTTLEKTKLYWTYKDEYNILKIQKTEFLSDSRQIKELTPFAGFSHKKYIKWFRKNRKKKKLLPIYKNYNDIFENRVNNWIVKFRQRIIDFLVKKRLK